METKLNQAATGVMEAARAAAHTRGEKAVSGYHVLLAAFRTPFPSLTMAFRASDTSLTPQEIADEMELVVKKGTLRDTDAHAFEKTLSGLAGKSDGEIGPELLVRAALAQHDGGIIALEALLTEVAPQLLDRLQSLGSLPPPPEIGEHKELRADTIGPRVAKFLSQAQTLAPGQVNTQVLIRVCVSDVSTLLAKGLLAVDAYEPVLRAVGGKVRIPAVKRLKCELERYTEYLRMILQQAFKRATAEGLSLLDERSLVLALIADAREDTASALASAGTHLRELHTWAERQPSLAEEDSAPGEVPLNQVVPFLQSRVINQDQAIREAYGPILRVRLGLGFDDALAGVLLFVGPPGVGKSYLAKLMAQTMYGLDPDHPEAHLVMVECGRYKDSHAVTDLIGAPHGYVGSDKGILRDGVRDKYPCVIVFDEAERMNLSIWDSLLTMFNDGVFRDNEGARYTLKDCVIVLTSNKGIEEAEDYRHKKLYSEHAAADALVAEAQKRLEGKAGKVKSGSRELLSPDEFWSNEDYRENYKAILLSRVWDHFGPALYNRIDEKIGFNGLREVDYIKIAANAVNDLIAHLEARTGVRLWYDTATLEVPRAIAGVVRSQIDASARDVNRFVRKYILDGAFAPLKLREVEDKKPLAPAYEIKPKMTGKKEKILDHFALLEAEPPQS